MIIDLQKNKMKVLITNYAGKYLDRFDFPIDHELKNNYTYIQECIDTVFLKYKKIKSGGIAIHGIVSNKTNVISSPFYTYEYNDIINIFKKYEMKIYVENEANIYTNGILVQKNLDIDNLMNIHIKDGVGSGQIFNGALYRGDNGYAGEIGHSIVKLGGKQCRCGNKGCLELYTSERFFIEQIESITKEKYNINDVASLVRENEDIFCIYEQIVDYLALKINDIVLLIDVLDLYITSDLFNEIDTFKEDILSRLNSRNYIKPKITVINANIEIFTSGFANIILLNQYGLN